jgi:hypothetical protein
MVLVLKSRKDIGRVKELLADLNPPKKFDAKKFNGALKMGEDGLKVQQRLRDEWQ